MSNSMYLKSVAVVVMLCAMSLGANVVESEDSQASSIVSKMKAKYKSIKSIEVNGYSKSEMTPKHKLDNTDANEMKLAAGMQRRTNFLIKLKRPDLYLVKWDTDSGAGSIKMRGAVYNDGTGDYLITANRMQKPENRRMALAGATGVSMGAAATLPALFFEEMWGGIPDRGFKKMQDEKIDDDDCYVLEQNLSSGKMINTIWISKSSLLLKRYQTIIIELPQRPDVNDAIMKMLANYKTIKTQTYTNTILDPNLAADQFKPSLKADPTSLPAGQSPSIKTGLNTKANFLIDPNFYQPAPAMDVNKMNTLIYTLDMNGLTPQEQRNLAQRTIDVLRKKLDPNGTRGLKISAIGDDKIRMQLPLTQNDPNRLPMDPNSLPAGQRKTSP